MSLDLSKLTDAIGKVADLAKSHASTSALVSTYNAAKVAAETALAQAQKDVDTLVAQLLAAATTPAEATGLTAVASALTTPAAPVVAPVTPVAPAVATVVSAVAPAVQVAPVVSAAAPAVAPVAPVAPSPASAPAVHVAAAAPPVVAPAAPVAPVVTVSATGVTFLPGDTRNPAIHH